MPKGKGYKKNQRIKNPLPKGEHFGMMTPDGKPTAPDAEPKIRQHSSQVVPKVYGVMPNPKIGGGKAAVSQLGKKKIIDYRTH